MAAIISKENYSAARARGNVQVLIISQSKQVATLLKNILHTVGFGQSYTVNDALEAIRYLREVRIHIVISDSELPVTHPDFTAKQEARKTVHGAEFVRSIRRSPTSPNPFVPVVILAEEINQDDIVKARDCGVNGVVLRPLEARQLCESIREIVETPRRFVVSETYKGPSRRRQQVPMNTAERRRKDICIVRNNG